MIHNKNEKENQDSLEIPQILPRLLLEWYDISARPLPWRDGSDPYRVWISEIMLQQTGAEVVKDYYTRFLESFPTIDALAAADEQKVLKLWEGLGYYARARNLQRAAHMIVGEYNGRFPDTYEKIRRLPGVGPYTAGAIASICYGQPVPAVDGNVVRVISRISGIYDEVTAVVKKRITSSLEKIYPPDRCGDFTQSLMELGALICVPNGTPKCDICPASDLCAAYRDGTVLSLPNKPRKQAKKLRDITVLVLTCGGCVALGHREDTGLLAGMWELPNVPGRLSDNAAVALAAEWGTKPAALVKSSARSHIFTHIKWDMICYYIECDEQPPRFTWVSRRQLADIYALPTAFKKFVEDREEPPANQMP